MNSISLVLAEGPKDCYRHQATAGGQVGWCLKPPLASETNGKAPHPRKGLFEEARKAQDLRKGLLEDG